jgi:hypothetical protein
MHVPKSWLYGLKQLAKGSIQPLALFFIGEISPKNNIKIVNFEILSNFGGDFQLPKLRKNGEKITNFL